MKLLLIIIVVILFFLLLYFVSLDWLVRFAYDRTCPQLPKSISQGVMGKKAKSKKKTSKSHERAEELKTKVSTEFELTSFDGTKLVGHYYPANNAKRIVICCHGWHSTWNYDFNGPAEFLHNNNCSLLLLELRAHGNSGGRYVYYGKKERFDIALWSDFIVKNISSELPIYIYGMSIGAMSSIMSTASGINANVKGIIADSSPNNVRDLADTVIKNIHLKTELVYPFIRLDSKLRIKMDDNEFTTCDALKTNKLPILFIHGTKDRVADIKYMKKMYEICNAPKKNFVVEGAGHMKSYYKETEQYQQKLKEFIDFCEK